MADDQEIAKLRKATAAMIREGARALPDEDVENIIRALQQILKRRIIKENVGPLPTDRKVEPNTAKALRAAMEDQWVRKDSKKPVHGLLWKEYPVRIRPLNRNTDFAHGRRMGDNLSVIAFLKNIDGVIEEMLEKPYDRQSIWMSVRAADLEVWVLESFKTDSPDEA